MMFLERLNHRATLLTSQDIQEDSRKLNPIEGMRQSSESHGALFTKFAKNNAEVLASDSLGMRQSLNNFALRNKQVLSTQQNPRTSAYVPGILPSSTANNSIHKELSKNLSVKEVIPMLKQVSRTYRAQSSYKARVSSGKLLI